MPTYEYRCPNGHDFERFFRSINTAQAEVTCPACGAVAARRISGGAGLLFKGSGFYITDYGKDGKKEPRPAAKSDAAGAPTDGASDKGAGSDAGATAPAADPAGESKPAATPKSSGSSE